MKKVMCFGTFDVLHLGHVNYFQQAKQYGDYLIVVIARDLTKEKQGKTTTFSEQERLELVKSLKVVDEAVLGNNEDHFKIIQEQKPDIICLGYDQGINENWLKENLSLRGLTNNLKRMAPYNPKRYKSSKIKNGFN